MKRKSQATGYTLIEILIVIFVLFVLANIAVFNYSSPKMKAGDTLAQENLRQASNSAMAFFIDHPNSTLTQTDLIQYGFRSSPNVVVSIIDGSLVSLLLFSRYNTPDAHAYIAYSNNIYSVRTPDQIALNPWIPVLQPGSNPTAAVLPVSSGQNGESVQQIPSPNIDDLMAKFNRIAQTDLQEAYITAQSFFRSNPEGVLTKDLLLAYGYAPNESVNLFIIDGNPTKLSMSAIFNIPGATSFGVDNSGNIISH
jgi:type II secretory pathway pseudopilin PulG